MTKNNEQIIIDDCIHLDEWKHCDICEKLIKTKDGANGKKREHLLIEEDLRCDFYPNCYYKQLKYLEKAFDYREKTCLTNLNNLADEAKFLREKLHSKEQECEELKEINSTLLEYRRHAATCQDCYEDGLEDGKTSNKELRKLKQTLAEIKPILKYYENSKIGEKQEDGSYKLEFTFSDIATPCCINYDPNPAREALRKINEVEDDRT